MTAEQFTDKDGLMARLEACYPRMSKGQRLLYRYVIAHCAEVSHMTAETFGKAVGVSESTVVRFAMFLGYDGYPRFKQAAERCARMRLNPAQILQDRFAGYGTEQVLKEVTQADANQIRSLSESMDPRAFADAADLILSAERIYIIGQAGMAPAAAYLTGGLRMVFPDVILLDGASQLGTTLPVLHIGAWDVLLVIGSGERTEDLIRLLVFAHARGAGIVTFFTDQTVRGYADCDCTGSAGSADAFAAGSLTVCISVLHALLTALYLQKPEEICTGAEAMQKLSPAAEE